MKTMLLILALTACKLAAQDLSSLTNTAGTHYVIETDTNAASIAVCLNIVTQLDNAGWKMASVTDWKMQKWAGLRTNAIAQTGATVRVFPKSDVGRAAARLTAALTAGGVSTSFKARLGLEPWLVYISIGPLQ